MYEILCMQFRCTLLITQFDGKHLENVLNWYYNPWQLKVASLFQFFLLLRSCRLYYFSLHDDYPPFLYTAQPIYIAALPFLINWNEKQFSKSKIMTMDHKPVLENSNLAAVYTLPNTYYLFIQISIWRP